MRTTKFTTTDFSELEKENQKKEEMLEKKLEGLEMALNGIENSYQNELSKTNEKKLESFIIKYYYNELEIIDELFIKADYFDPRGANLLMDEIDDRIERLQSNLERAQAVKLGGEIAV